MQQEYESVSPQWPVVPRVMGGRANGSPSPSNSPCLRYGKLLTLDGVPAGPAVRTHLHQPGPHRPRRRIDGDGIGRRVLRRDDDVVSGEPAGDLVPGGSPARLPAPDADRGDHRRPCRDREPDQSLMPGHGCLPSGLRATWLQAAGPRGGAVPTMSRRASAREGSRSARPLKDSAGPLRGTSSGPHRPLEPTAVHGKCAYCVQPGHARVAVRGRGSRGKAARRNSEFARWVEKGAILGEI